MGQRITDLRKGVKWTDAAGIHRTSMTQQELADIVGLQRSNLSRIESWRYSVGFDILQSIAGALVVNVDIVTPTN